MRWNYAHFILGAALDYIAVRQSPTVNGSCLFSSSAAATLHARVASHHMATGVSFLALYKHREYIIYDAEAATPHMHDGHPIRIFSQSLYFHDIACLLLSKTLSRRPLLRRRIALLFTRLSDVWGHWWCDDSMIFNISLINTLLDILASHASSYILIIILRRQRTTVPSSLPSQIPV